MIPRLCYAATLAALFACLPAAAQDFKGHRFGSSLDATKQAFPAFECIGQADAATCHFSGSGNNRMRFTYAGAEVKSARLEIIGDQFCGADVTMAATAFELTRMALEAKHGTPASTVTEEIRTQGGVSSTNTIVTWRLAGGGYVRATRYAGAITESSVRARAPACEQADSERLRQRVEAAKRDV